MDSQTKRNIGYPTLNQHQRPITRKQIKGCSDEVENRCVSVEEKCRIRRNLCTFARSWHSVRSRKYQTDRPSEIQSFAKVFERLWESFANTFYTFLSAKQILEIAIGFVRRFVSEQWTIILLVSFCCLLICPDTRQGFIFLSFILCYNKTFFVKECPFLFILR